MIVISLQNLTTLDVTNFRYEVFTTDGRTRRVLVAGTLSHCKSYSNWRTLLRKLLEDVASKETSKARRVTRPVTNTPVETKDTKVYKVVLP